MALIDEIREIARQKETYRPGVVAAPTQPTFRQKRYAERPPALGGRSPALSGVESRVPSTGTLPAWATPSPNAPQVGGDDSGGGIGGLAGDIFDGIIEVVDTPRSAVAATIAQINDPSRDWSEDFWNNIGMAEAYDLQNSDLLGPAAATGVGFAADILFDPLTYLTAGTVKGASTVGKGVKQWGALDEAIRRGGRLDIAETLASESARLGLVDDFAEPLQKLHQAAGQRGRGAVTPRGLAREGVDPELLDKLGVTARFGTTVGVGRKRVRIPGTQKAAEAAEDLKGVFKKWSGASRGGRMVRQLFRSADNAERKYVEMIMTGSPNSAAAARSLVALKQSKAQSLRWSREAIESANRDLPELAKLSDEDSRAIVRAIELGETFDNDLAARVGQWYDTMFKQLEEAGVDITYRGNYVNHILTPEARQLRMADHPMLVNQGLDAEVVFQKTRELQVGDKFLGQTIRRVDGQALDNNTATIEELNRIGQEVLGIKVYEDNLQELMGSYVRSGQVAHMRASIVAQNEAMGVATEIGEKVDTKALNAARRQQQEIIDRETLAMSDEMRAASKKRKQGLSEAAKSVRGQRGDIARAIKAVEKQLDDYHANIVNMENKITRLQGQLSALEVANRQAQTILDASRKKGAKKLGTEKGRLTRLIKKNQAEIDDINKQIEFTSGKLRRARKPEKRAEWQAQLDSLNAQYDQADKQLARNEKTRAAMDEMPVPHDKAAAKEVARTAKGAQEVRGKFLTETKEYTDASQAWVWQLMDNESQLARLHNVANEFDDIDELARTAPGVGRRGTTDEALALMTDAHDELRRRTGVVLKKLETSEDPVLDVVKGIEAQAAAHDMNAWRVHRKAATEAKRQLAVLDDPEFRGYMTQVLEDNYVRLNDRLQVPEWWAEANQKLEWLKTDAGWEDMRDIMNKYDKAMNWWKGFATASPGFVVRNWYSGMYGMYLDGVSPYNAARVSRFALKYERKGRQAAMDWAQGSKMFNDVELRQLEQAIDAAAASGWGLTPQEFTHRLVGERTSANPLSPSFGPVKVIRNASGGAEAMMRITHAFDVINKGGDLPTAIDRVTRFHFNYRDITEFDRWAKRVVPFWTFFSRNMALQAEVWTRFPQKLNRTYFNLKRNLELNSDPDAATPEFFDMIGAIRTPFSMGGTVYFTPDLPSLRFRQDIAQLTGTGEGGEGIPNPLDILSDAGPAIKVPYEMYSNKDTFFGGEFKNRYYDYDSEGEPYARLAPSLMAGKIPGIGPIDEMDIPVVTDLVQQGMSLLPGAEVIDGELVMTDKLQGAIEDSAPVLARGTRLFPNTPRMEDRAVQNYLSFGGVPVRANTEDMQRTALYFEQKEAEEQARKEAEMEAVRRMIGGG